MKSVSRDLAPTAPDFVRHLTGIYGETMARAVEPRLRSLLEKWRLQISSTPALRPRGALTERDALLISYADQVTAPGVHPLEALADFTSQHLDGVVSGIHLLPFYPWSSDDGFSVKDYYAVDPAFGTWEDIERIGRTFDLMFDAVFNHMSAQSEWFIRFLAGDPDYHDFFVTVEGEPDLLQVIRPRALPLLTEFSTSTGSRKVWTTFSADQVDLNFRNPAVLLALVDALLFYVSKGAKFIRLDAIAFLWKEIGTTCLHLPETHRAIQFMRAVLEAVAPGVMLITETNVPHRDNISYFGDGTNEAQLVYNFALPPLVLHSFASGDAQKLTAWAQSLTLPSDQVAFFNFLASHDGIGVNPARGILSASEIDSLVERVLRHGGFISYKNLPDGSQIPYEMNINFFDALSDPASDEPVVMQVDRMICAHAIQLALAGMPGIYFHSLFGSRGDRPGAEASGIPRRINRQKLTRAGLERDLADEASLRTQVFTGLRELLSLRRAAAPFAPAGPQEILSVHPSLFVVLRTSPDGHERMLCVQNVANETLKAVIPLPRSIPSAQWLRVLGTETAPTTDGEGDVLRFTLKPYEVNWMKAKRG